MILTKLLFKLIDYFGYIPQNTYHDKNAIMLAKDLVYCNKNIKLCSLDIYCNKDKQNICEPVLINFHGGGFVAGDKKYRKSFSEYCTKFGLKVLNINYGLAPNHNLIQILQEVISIFDWIKENSKKYNLDTNKIILCGDSAGAYIATCITALTTNEKFANAINLTKIDTKIAGLILFSGIYYPTDSLYTIMPLGINHSLWEYLCGEKFKDCDTCKSYKYYNALNVGEYVTADFPPIFISYSKTDIFCKGNGEKLVNNLKDLNIPFFSVYSITNMHDWQENMFTKSSKMTLKHFDSFMKNLLSEKIDSTQNSSITIKLGKIVKE